jgi:hypothetical protein
VTLPSLSQEKPLPPHPIEAAKLPRRHSSTTASDIDTDRDSVVSMGFVDADLLTLEPDERMLTYAEKFGRRFPLRRLNPETNFIERRKREDGQFSILHASSLRHYHLACQASIAFSDRVTSPPSWPLHDPRVT